MDVVELADSQVRVARFRHQGRLWDRYLDCIGLIVGAHVKAGYPHRDYATYGRTPNPKQLIREMELAAERVPDGQEDYGDVVLLGCHQMIRDLPHHVAILAPPKPGEGAPSIIHAHMETEFVQRVSYAGAWPGNTYGFWRWRQ